MHRRAILLVLFAASALTACGAGGNGPGSPSPVVPGRGTLLQNPPILLSTESVALLLSKLGGSSYQQLLALSGVPLCDIQIYQIRYATVGGASEATTASGALMVPSGVDARCHEMHELSEYLRR